MHLNEFRDMSGLKLREEQILKDVRQKRNCIEQMVVFSQVQRPAEKDLSHRGKEAEMEG